MCVLSFSISVREKGKELIPNCFGLFGGKSNLLGGIF